MRPNPFLNDLICKNTELNSAANLNGEKKQFVMGLVVDVVVIVVVVVIVNVVVVVVAIVVVVEIS